MSVVQKPKVIVIYQGRDISNDLKDHVLSVTYTDNVKGTSDEIELELEDKEGNWRNGWYPQKNDTISLQMGYEDDLIQCGTFKVDEIEMKGPPDTVTIKALACPTSKSLRTKTSKAHEGKSLRTLAEETAKAHDLTVDDGTHPVTLPGPSSEDRAILQTYGNEMRTVSVKKAPDVWGFSKAKVEQVIGSLEGKGYVDEVSYLRKAYNAAVAIFEKENVFDETTGDEKPGTTAEQRWSGVFGVGEAMLVVYNRIKGIGYTHNTTFNGVLFGIQFERITQNNETDLAFLSRVCDDYGIIFSIRDTKLIFTSIYSLEQRSAVTKVDRNECISYSFKDKITGTFKSAHFRYHNSKTGEIVEAQYGVQTLKNVDGVEYKQITAPDTLNIRNVRAETQQQAEQIVKARLHEKNSKGTTGNISVPGNPRLIAGNNFDLTGFGEISGLYHITKSVHKIARGEAYLTDIDHKGVGTVSSSSKKTNPLEFKPTPRPEDTSTNFPG